MPSVAGRAGGRDGTEGTARDRATFHQVMTPDVPTHQNITSRRTGLRDSPENRQNRTVGRGAECQAGRIARMAAIKP